MGEWSTKDAVSSIAVLAGSPTRVQILEQLYEHGPQEKHTLRQQVAGCRTTLLRNLDLLEEHGWIENAYPTYSITSTGRLIMQHFLPLLEAVDVAEQVAPFLDRFPIEETPLSYRDLKHATVAVSTSSEPYAPITLHIDALKRAEEVRLLLPVMGVDAMETARRQMRERGADYEVILDRDVADTIRSDSRHAATVEEMSVGGHLELYIADEPVPYYLGIFDGSMVEVGVSDENGFPRAVIELDTSTVLQWASTVYSDHKDAAHPFTPAMTSSPA